MKKMTALVLLALSCHFAIAQAGEPDNSFGTNGRVNLPVGEFDDFANAVAIQSDGKIVIAGISRVTEISNGNRHDFSAARLNVNGTPDNSFDGDGKVIIPIDQHGSFAHAVMIQPDQKILLAGYSISDDGEDFAIARINANGTADNTFGGDGNVIIPVGLIDDQAFAIAMQADGKILVAGSSLENATLNDFSVIRLNTDGSLDNSFDSDGKLIISMSTNNDVARGIAIQDDGKIVVGGEARIVGAERDFAIARINSDGTLDNTFDGDGKKLVSITATDIGNALAIDGAGRIVMAGRTDDNFGIARLNSDGSLDNTFQGGGLYNVSVGTGFDEGRALAIQTDGKILVAGESQSGTGFNFSIIRLNVDGTLDNSFNGDGKHIIPSMPVSSFGERARGMAIQANGQIVLAGVNGALNAIPTDPAVDFLIMRLHAEGVLPVRLLDFDATYRNNRVELSWLAEDEINFSHYEIERSTDRVIFQQIESVKGSKMEGISAYQSFDLDRGIRNKYYRLKMVDVDGRHVYSQIVSIVMSDDQSLILYPNPASDHIAILGENDFSTIQIVNANGCIVKSFSSPGNHSLNISDVAPGIYIVRFIGVNCSLSSQILVY